MLWFFWKYSNSKSENVLYINYYFVLYIIFNVFVDNAEGTAKQIAEYILMDEALVEEEVADGIMEITELGETLVIDLI